MVSQTDIQTQLKSLISLNECNDIITKAFNSDRIKIIDYEINEANKEFLGFMGQYFRLKIFVEKESGEVDNIYFFVKSLPLNNAPLNNIIETYGFFRKEVQIYKTIFSQMKKQSVETKWHPECYLVRDDIFVFEDLKFLGYDHISIKIEFPKNYMEAALIALARVHSSTFQLEQDVFMENENICEKYNDLFFETFTRQNTFFATGVKFIKLLALRHPVYGEKYREQIEKDLQTITNRFFDILEPSKKFKNVLCHRDLWINNFMFKKTESGISCIIVDYQKCRISPPAVDFLLFLYSNTRQSDRNFIFKEYQEFYYSALIKESRRLGIDEHRLPSHDEFLESCEFYKLIPLVYSGISIPMTILPSEILGELQANDPKKYNYYFHVDRSELVFDQMEKNEYYRNYLFEIVGEIIEEYIIKSH